MIREKKKTETYTYTPTLALKNAVKLAMCYPFTYAVGMSSLGFLSLFKILDMREDVKAYRVFSDSDDKYFNKKEYELCGFSVSFEIDFIGFLKMLEKAGIPFKSESRAEDDPLIFAGGPAVSSNPEPFADFFDFVVLGDGEEVINEIVDVYKNTRNSTRKEKLLKLSELDGVYVPSLYRFEFEEGIEIKSITPDKKVKIRHNKDIGCNYSPILTPDSIFKKSFVIETSRGCPKKCLFCLASWLNLPARYPKLEKIKQAIDLGLEKSDKISLLGALISEHPEFDEICNYILEKRKVQEFELSVSSLRIDNLNPLTVKTLVECGQKTVAISVEAGSDRLRKYINKNLTNRAIIKGVKTAHDGGLKGLKLYAMIGLPSETMEDIDELIELAKTLKKENKGFSITLSASSFVPKAQTPFERQSREGVKTLEMKNNYIKKALIKTGIDYKPTSPKWDYIQAMISRGDRRLGEYFLKVYEYGSSLGSFKRAKKEFLELPFDDFALAEREKNSLLPWSIVDNG